MTDENNGLELTRRKALAGIGGIGVASAGAGLGTSAYFSDEESFEGNSLTAGELQLHGSWQQIYYGPDENSDHYEPYGSAGKPWVSAHPDDDENGIQSWNGDSYVKDPSDDPAEGRNISISCDEFDAIGEAPTPVIDLDDVKPGDKGEVTFGLTLCDNPGYLWMQSELTEEENVPDKGEEHLLDFLRARVWYDDDCDNVRDGCVDTDLMMTIDMSGSMFYERYGGVVSNDPIDIDGDGINEYQETTTIDMVEKALFEFVSETIEKLEEEEETEEGGCDVNVGLVFFNGYHDNGPNIKTVDFTDGSIADLEALIAPGGDLRELRNQVADLTDGPTEPDGDASGIDTGTALEEGVDEAESILDDHGVTDNRQNVLVTDGTPWRPGKISKSDFEGALRAADEARSGGETSICVLGDTAGEDDGSIFTQQTMAGPAGSGINVGDATDTAWQMYNGNGTLADNDPGDFGGDLSFWFDLQEPDAAAELFAKKGAGFLGEPIIAEGTMREVLSALNSDGIELHTTPLINEHGCFPAEELICLGFEWEFPIGQDDVNDAQGDSLTFDLSFYTEQCRHNDNPTGPPTAGD